MRWITFALGALLRGDRCPRRGGGADLSHKDDDQKQPGATEQALAQGIS